MARPDILVDLHLVLLRDECILMGERRNTAFASGQYHVPAGHLEAGETIIDGLIREAREETGIAIAPEDVHLSYVMHVHEPVDRLSMFFAVDRWSGEIENREPDRCAGWEWRPVRALPVNTVPYARKAIADIVAEKQLGVFGW